MFARLSIPLIMMACQLPSAARAEADSAFKLTAGRYDYGNSQGHDVNLRWRGHDSNVWLGYYQDPDFGKQWRTGLDSSWALSDWAQLQPSLQLATQGFVGGSLNLQVGGEWYGLLGWGRTNLRPYFNLNFDPNDALSLGLGWRGAQGLNLSLSVIADDRLHTGQQHWHATLRWPLPEQQRLTLDILYKKGMGDEGEVRAYGWSFTYDWPRWFLHLAVDPKQNFSATDAKRLSVGLRF